MWLNSMHHGDIIDLPVRPVKSAVMLINILVISILINVRFQAQGIAANIKRLAHRYK